MADRLYSRRRSIAGPIILMVIGVFFLLLTTGAITRARLGWWFALYWPVLLIAVGIIRLVEYIIARRNDGPIPRFGGGTIFVLILFTLIGMGATRARHVNWQAFNDNVDVDTNFDAMFNQKYEFNDQQQQPVGSSAQNIQIESEYGSVKIHSADDGQIKMTIHRRIAAGSQDEANKLNAENRPSIALEGNTLRIQSARPGPSVHVGFYFGPRVVTDLEIWAPKNMPVNLSGSHGDVAVDNRKGDVALTTTHGDIQVDSIKGNVSLTTHHGSVKAQKIEGSVSINGRIDDTEISEVSGPVTLDGDFFGETRFTKIGGGVQFNSSRTELHFARLDGDLHMDNGDLRGSSISGPFLLRTKAKDVHLDNISGDITVEDSQAEVEVHPGLRAGNVDVQNRQGAIHMVLLADAAFNIQARSEHGDIETDLDLAKENNGPETTATGNVGKGGPTMHLSTQHGVIEIRKG